jgi:hypothetical protein
MTGNPEVIPTILGSSEHCRRKAAFKPGFKHTTPTKIEHPN